MRIETEHSARLREAVACFESGTRYARDWWSRRGDDTCIRALDSVFDCAESVATQLDRGERSTIVVEQVRAYVVELARELDRAWLRGDQRRAVAVTYARVSIIDLLEMLSELEDELVGD